MEDYNKIIESLNVKINSIRRIGVLNPVMVENYYDVQNTILLLNKGNLSFNNENSLEVGDILFIPSGQATSITYGSRENSVVLTNEELSNNMDQHFLTDNVNDDCDSFSFITFDSKVFESVNFFQSLDIPTFVIKSSDKIKYIISDILNENRSSFPGKQRIIKLDTEKLVVEIVRYILSNNLFVEQLATNATYFKDPRLLDIFGYIKENLNGDLSNKALANVANVSEDYVGQYFKMLTGINPQDYIEYQRMEHAVDLLRTSKKSIRDIGKIVGYRDTAYFCRRFKMMFGISAGKMRRRESTINF